MPLKSIEFNFPIYRDGQEVRRLLWEKGNTVETIFMWNGVGKMAVDAVSMHDIPVIQAYLVWMAAIYLLLHLIADLLMGALDPRAKLEGMR